MLAPPSARNDACTWVDCAHLTTLRLFSIGSDGGFTEYERSAFETDHEEAVLEEWLASNPDGILEDGRILIIGRQVRTDLGGFIDLLGVDREGSVVVVELKRDRTPREAVAQALEYAAFAERLDIEALEDVVCRYQNDESLSLADHHRTTSGLTLILKAWPEHGRCHGSRNRSPAESADGSRTAGSACGGTRISPVHPFPPWRRPCPGWLPKGS